MPVHAFIFPGQGSQSIGMGRDLAASFAAAREVFEEVDEVLKQKLSKLMFQGPADELTLTENTQPALMAVSLAVLRVMEKESGFRMREKAAVVSGKAAVVSAGEPVMVPAVMTVVVGVVVLAVPGAAVNARAPNRVGVPVDRPETLAVRGVVGGFVPVHRRLTPVNGEQIVRETVGEVVQIGEVDLRERAGQRHRIAPGAYLAASG